MQGCSSFFNWDGSQVVAEVVTRMLRASLPHLLSHSPSDPVPAQPVPYLTPISTERLRHSIKYEKVYLHDYDTPRQARQQLTAYLSFYNEQRPHQSLAYRTPAEVYFAG